MKPLQYKRTIELCSGIPMISTALNGQRIFAGVLDSLGYQILTHPPVDSRTFPEAGGRPHPKERTFKKPYAAFTTCLTSGRSPSTGSMDFRAEPVTCLEWDLHHDLHLAGINDDDLLAFWLIFLRHEGGFAWVSKDRIHYKAQPYPHHTGKRSRSTPSGNEQMSRLRKNHRSINIFYQYR